MRFYPSIFQKVKTGFFAGESKTNGRVTVEPLWQLKSTPPAYGNSARGPYRYFQSLAGAGVEWEIPNIRNIKIDRSETQDLASCTITMYNMWHEGNLQSPELAGQLGKPGYFWPKRGLGTNIWNQTEAKGAFRKDGFWDPNFSWQNVIVQYALLRTYEGFGGHPTPDTFYSIDDNLANENVLLTGTWLISTVDAGSDGIMTINCVDMGKLALDQICFPPTVPPALYPLEYYPEGQSAFDSTFGAKPQTGVSPASFGEVLAKYHDSSLDQKSGGANTAVAGHTGSHAVDGNWQTFSLTEAYATPDASSSYPWIEFSVNANITKLSLKAWAGGYDCYICVSYGGSWLGSEDIPNWPGTKFIKKINIPLAIPDNMESVIHIDLPPALFGGDKSFPADNIRLVFNNLYYSGIPNESGYEYRAGIRDFVVYREGAHVSKYDPDFTVLPWTFAMAAHPTRGYWVVDTSGNVYGFGDAADYDSTGFGPVDLGGHVGNVAMDMAAHPDGKGYWVLARDGSVHNFGSASHFGEHVVSLGAYTDKLPNYWNGIGECANGIAATHTGNGYWVIYGDGSLKGFGDAAGFDTVLPTTAVGSFMEALYPGYLYQHKGGGVASHPTEIGCWVTNGSGEVFAFGAAQHYGQLNERVYNPGMGNSFRLRKTEFTRTIEATTTGKGYWIVFPSGHMAAFGDAVGKGSVDIYPLDLSDDIPDDEVVDWSFFRALIWDAVRDPDGSGFWVLAADGSVKGFDAAYWGAPGYSGASGYRWHQGNFDGDWSQIMKELLLWSGFTLHDPNETGAPQLFGAIESTGIKTDTVVNGDKFDKRPVIDVIKELCEVVAYRFRIGEDGGAIITSPNYWRAGNFDEIGDRIYVTNADPYTRVSADNPDAVPFIPEVHELYDMINFSAQLSSDSMRSELVIGTDLPDPKAPTTTAVTRLTPRSGSEEVAPGIKMLRNIPKVGIWISQLFQNAEETALMAELISLTSWFAERTATATCVANPALSIGDQVKFVERNTGEYNIHYVSGISSNNDLDSGVWTMNLTTHWLGDKDNWVITADNVYHPVNGSHFIEISERVDRWQQYTGRGLERGGASNGSTADLVNVQGAFDMSVTTIGTAEVPGQWNFLGTLQVSKNYTDMVVQLDNLSAPLGTGAFISLSIGGTTLISEAIPGPNQQVSLPPLGTDGTTVTYDLRIVGVPTSVGNGLLNVSFRDSTGFKGSASDTLLVVR